MIHFVSTSWAQVNARAGVRVPSGISAKRSVILIRFRKFIEGERLTSWLVDEFLKSRAHWWLLTTDEAERAHAEAVLSRLYLHLGLHEQQVYLDNFEKNQEI